jgi:transposase
VCELIDRPILKRTSCFLRGIDSERGIAWRASDSLAVRAFVRLPVNEPPPDHTTISRTRRTIDLESHRAVFTWVQQRLVAAGLLKGKTVVVDGTTLEANAAMRSIVRRDTGERYQEFLTGLAQASGIATPTREDLARLDRKRKKKTSNEDLEISLGSRREDREDERWPHAPGLQS